MFKNKKEDQKATTNKYTSALKDYSQLDPALMDALLDFEKEEEPPAETVPPSNQRNSFITETLPES